MKLAMPAMGRAPGRTALLLAHVLCVAFQVRAQPERLTVRTFDVDDGLAHASIRRIVSDSSGFLWFCTEGGLSRFDGSRFVSYGKAEGLGSRTVSDLREDTERAIYWVGTGAGLYRFAAHRPPAAGRMFEKVDLPIGGSVRRLLLDRQNRLWIATIEGLAVLEGVGRDERARRVLPDRVKTGVSEAMLALLEDTDGAIWVGTQGEGLYRIAPDGIALHQFPARVHGLNFIRDLLKGPDGRIWCTFFGGITRLHPNPEKRVNPVAQTFDASSGMLSIDTTHLLAGSGGEILAGTSAGIARLQQDRRGGWQVAGLWTMREGLTSDAVSTLAFDPGRNLWIGTGARGAMRLAAEGFQRYPDVEESATFLVGMTGDGSDGVLALAAVAQNRYRIHHLTESGQQTLDVKMPQGLSYLGWGGPRFVRAREGGYWIATGEGLLRYASRAHGAPGLERLRDPPDRRFGPADGLPGLDIFWIEEDSRGTLWVDVANPKSGLSSLARYDPSAGRFTSFPETIGSVPGDLAMTLAEGPEGTVWVSFASGKVVRIDRDGHFTPVIFDPPIAAESAPRLAFDSSRRLWILAEGVWVADGPIVATVHLSPGPPALAGTYVYFLVEDTSRRMYFGTERGLFRLNEGRDAARLFTRVDGLPGDSVRECVRDARGRLWFCDRHGVARLTPSAEPDPPPVHARIAALRIDGEAVPIAPLGTSEPGPIELAPGPHRVAAEFFAISHIPGERILFQHRLEGNADWSVPSDARTLEFPHLVPGRHRLLVRAVQEHGADAPPVVLELLIPAPIWQRWWFLMLSVAGLVAVASVAYRRRVARLLALERMRTGIATDLHDAVGADLSRISLLADFTQRYVDDQPARARTMLGEVARTARDAVREMSDIVWALKSTPGDLSQVLSRVRDFAADVADPAGISFRMSTDVDPSGVLLSDEGRRDLYLILKEAVNNAIRHSGARTLALDVRAKGRGIVAELRDDGCGFRSEEAPEPSLGGHGIGNMRARAARLGGTLSFRSAPGAGTMVRVELPRT